MTETVTTNNRAKFLAFVFVVFALVALLIWVFILFITTPEEPKAEQPATSPITCEEVKQEVPAELPKTGVDL